MQISPFEMHELRRKYKKVIYVDIDSTICYCNEDNPQVYSDCYPYPKRIEKINKLYDEGNYILYWTARGTCTGIDWTELTKKQLDNWGCKYHKVVLKKPFYDLFIDDKNINSEVYFDDC